MSIFRSCVSLQGHHRITMNTAMYVNNYHYDDRQWYARMCNQFGFNAIGLWFASPLTISVSEGTCEAWHSWIDHYHAKVPFKVESHSGSLNMRAVHSNKVGHLPKWRRGRQKTHDIFTCIARVRERNRICFCFARNDLYIMFVINQTAQFPNPNF